MKILVIEDDPTSLKLVKFALEKNNYEVIGAENGHKGYAVAQSEP